MYQPEQEPLSSEQWHIMCFIYDFEGSNRFAPRIDELCPKNSALSPVRTLAVLEQLISKGYILTIGLGDKIRYQLTEAGKRRIPRFITTLEKEP